MRGDLAEFDSLQHVKLATVMRDRVSLDATNRELAGVIKELKKRSEEEGEKMHHLDTEFKLLHANFRRTSEENERQGMQIQDLEGDLKSTRDNLAQQIELLATKKSKWKGRITALQADLDKMKEENINLSNQVAHYEKLTLSQDNMITEEKEKIIAVEEKLENLKSQLEEAKKEAAANHEKTSAQESELAEMTVRLQYETRGNIDLKKEIENLKLELAEKDGKMEELRKEHRKKKEKIIATKDQEINAIRAQNDDLKATNSKNEARVNELENTMEEMRTKLEDTLRQLGLCEVKISELVREKEAVIELKAIVEEKDRELEDKRDYSVVGYRLSKET